MTAQQIKFSLDITSDQFLAVYKGHAKNISAIAMDGRRVEFGAEKIRQFLTHGGIHGTFEMEISEDNRFLSIKRLA